MTDKYMCRGKPGTYEKLGVSKGAGLRANERLVVYRSCQTGEIFHREIRDFEYRMVGIIDEDPDVEARLACILDKTPEPSPAMREILELDTEGGTCD